MQILKVQLKELFGLWKIVFNILSITILMIMFKGIWSAAEMGYSTCEFIILILGLSATTGFYSKYFRNNFWIKQNSWWLIFFITFSSVFIYLMFYSLIYFILFYLMYSQNVITDSNFLNLVDPIYFKRIQYGYLIYSIFLESIIIISYAFLLNIFLKNLLFVYGAVIVLICYSFLFGNVFFVYSDFGYRDTETNTYYLTMMNSFPLRQVLNVILMPWNQVGILAKRSIWASGYNTSSSLGFSVHINMWDYSHLGWYRILRILPFITVGLSFGSFATKNSRISKL